MSMKLKFKSKTTQNNDFMTKDECLTEINEAIESNILTIEQLNKIVRLLKDPERLKTALMFLK